ncbi:MAG: amidohydrolase family protein [Planctomycetota bacterium]
MTRLIIFLSGILFALTLGDATASTVTGQKGDAKSNSTDAASNRLVVKASSIVVSPGKIIPRGVMVIENGKITAIGTDLGIPKSSILKDYGKATIAAGFVDALSDAGILEDATDSTTAFTPAVRAADAIRLRDWSIARAARNGVTTIGTNLHGVNVVCGIGAIAKTDGSEGVIKPEAFLKLCLTGNSIQPNRYPTSVGSAIGRLSSMLTESKAPWLSLSPREQLAWDRLQKDLRPWIEVDNVSTLRRVLRLSSEHKFKPVIVAQGDISDAASELVSANIPVVLAELSFQSPPIQRRQVTILAKAGVEFAFASVDSARKNPSNGLRISSSIAASLGVAMDTALRAISVIPAKLLGIEARVGTLEVGKDADFVVMSGDILDLSSTHLATFVNGTIVKNPEAR